MFWKPPMSVSLNFHHVGIMKASEMAENNGAFRLHGEPDGYETMDITIFTGNPQMACDMADALNAVFAKYQTVKESAE